MQYPMMSPATALPLFLVVFVAIGTALSLSVADPSNRERDPDMWVMSRDVEHHDAARYGPCPLTQSITVHRPPAHRSQWPLDIHASWEIQRSDGAACEPASGQLVYESDIENISAADYRAISRSAATLAWEPRMRTGYVAQVDGLEKNDPHPIPAQNGTGCDGLRGDAIAGIAFGYTSVYRPRQDADPDEFRYAELSVLSPLNATNEHCAALWQRHAVIIAQLADSLAPRLPTTSVRRPPPVWRQPPPP